MGVGEVIIASIDRDGTRDGYDIDLVRSVTSFAPIPVIVHGGAGSFESILAVINEGQADAVSASSIFHYRERTIGEVKKFLGKNGVNVRVS